MLKLSPNVLLGSLMNLLFCTVYFIIIMYLKPFFEGDIDKLIIMNQKRYIRCSMI